MEEISSPSQEYISDEFYQPTLVDNDKRVQFTHQQSLNDSIDSSEIGLDVPSVRLIPPLERESLDYIDPDDSGSLLTADDFIEQSVSSKKEEAVSINISKRKYTKLEIISSNEVTKLLYFSYGFRAFGILFSIVFVILANTVYLRLDDLEGTQARYYRLPSFFSWLFSIAGLLCFMYAVSLAIVYTSRIVRCRRQDRTHEQVWVILLTLAAAIYLNPYETITRILADSGYNLSQESWYDPISRFYDSARDASFTASTIFYVWATTHSYRILGGRLTSSFYLPKVCLVLFYVLLKQLAFWRYSIYMSEMPIASLVAMIYLYKSLNTWPLSGVLFVTFTTCFEILLLFWIVRQTQITKAFLQGNDYMEYRTKQIGFRFFHYHNIMFYFTFWICYLLILLGLPAGPQLAAMRVFQVSYVEVQYVPFGLSLLYLSYVTVEAYTKLPADAIGIRGWVHPQAPKIDGLLEPITYRKREIQSQEVQTNCFIMETQVYLFNFAWLVYYYGTPKMNRLGKRQAKFDYNVEDVVSCEATDTRALLISADDRIIISFRGTSSMRNLRTDLKAFHVKLSRVLPTRLDTDNNELEHLGGTAQTFAESREAHKAKVHHGFAEAYASVAEAVMSGICSMYHSNPRPIFLTGHSLGGALATICAYDCVLRLDLEPNDIYVSTFGSPRVGNSSFRRLYDAAVPATWRVSIAPDIITKLPKLYYSHVGKKVMLTTAGDLFIDPNILELSQWSGDGASWVHHRKSSYMLAMRSWCNRYENGAYKPPFWEWPYSPDDERRWPNAVSGIIRTNKSEEYPRNLLHRRNLLHQDAMIDAMNESRPENSADRAIENWARLSRRLLLNVNVHRTPLVS